MHETKEWEKKKSSAVAVVIAAATLFSLVFLSLYDIIKDPPIFSNAVADVQADVFTRATTTKNREESRSGSSSNSSRKKRIYLCISFMCRVHSTGKRQQVDFFSFRCFAFFFAFLRRPTESVLFSLPAAMIAFVFHQTTLLFFFIISSEALLFNQAKAIHKTNEMNIIGYVNLLQ